MKYYNLSPSVLSSKFVTAGLFTVHFLVTIFFARKNQPWLTGDSERYLQIAANLRNGTGFGLFDGGGAFQPEGLRDIGYPLFIAFCQKVTFTETAGIVAVQIFLFLASVFLIWKVSEKLFNQLTADFFLVLSAFYPFVANSSSLISPEIPTVFLIASAAFFLLRPGLMNVFLAALCIGLSAYFRANLIFLSFFSALVFLLFSRRYAKYSAVFAVTALLVAAPNIWRNYQVFGQLKPVPVYSATGHSLLTATWQYKVSAQSIIDYSMKGTISEEMKQAGLLEQIDFINDQAGMRHGTIVTTPESYPTNESKALANAASSAKAIENIKENPFSYLKSSLINFFRLWFSANFPDSVNPILKFMLLVEGTVTFLLGVIGMVLAFFRTTKISLAFVFVSATIIYLSLTLCWLHTEARYTITARLLLLMFAAYTLALAAEKFFGRTATQADNPANV